MLIYCKLVVILCREREVALFQYREHLKQAVLVLMKVFPRGLSLCIWYEYEQDAVNANILLSIFNVYRYL